MKLLLSSSNCGWGSSRRPPRSQRGGLTLLNLAIGEAYGFMRESAAGNYDPGRSRLPLPRSIIAATNNRFYQPLGALVRTALSLTAPITNAIFGHAVGDLVAHGEVLLAIERRRQRAFDLMRGLLSHVARKVAEAKGPARPPDRRPVAAPGKVSKAYWAQNVRGPSPWWSRWKSMPSCGLLNECDLDTPV